MARLKPEVHVEEDSLGSDTPAGHFGVTRQDALDMSQHGKRQHFHRNFTLLPLIAFTASRKSSYLYHNIILLLTSPSNVHMGSRLLRQQHRHDQRRSANTHLRLRVLLHGCTGNCCLSSSDGIVRANVRWPISLGVYAGAERHVGLLVVAYRLVGDYWMVCHFVAFLLHMLT